MWLPMRQYVRHFHADASRFAREQPEIPPAIDVVDKDLLARGAAANT